jgi:alpha-amylase
MKRKNTYCYTDTKRQHNRSIVACASVLVATAACAPNPYRANLSEPTLDTNSAAAAAKRLNANQANSAEVLVHLFEWKWNDIARECEAFLGPAGVHSVQISPPNEHRKITRAPWWQRYQPVSYRLESRSGNAAEFKAMVERCNAVGVNIVADAVVNHMSSGTADDVRVGRGIAGSIYSKYSYPGLYTQNDFNTCDGGKPANIANYQDPGMVRNCELVGLSDLKTSSEKVRNQVSSYLNGLLKLGVSGFRIDAAKHIQVEDLEAIIGRLNKRDNIFLEVIEGRGEPIKASQYIGAGRVTEFRYPEAIRDAFRSGQLNELMGLAERSDVLPSAAALVFIDNHDTQRGHGAGGSPLSHKEPQLYELANAFMLAYPYGRPSIMSSYRFDNADQGPPSDANQQTRTALKADLSSCTTGWVCEHRWPGIAGMVGFRNATHKADIRNIWSNGNDQLAFARGDRGFLAINRALKSSVLDRQFQTGMPPGRYCNVFRAGQAMETQTCRDNQVTVGADGTAKIRIDGIGAVAIHVGSRSGD